jgi:acetyl-CoA carboxylase beta subunit
VVEDPRHLLEEAHVEHLVRLVEAADHRLVLIGFAGERVIRETIRQQLPQGFQRAEFLVEKGFVDIIAPRPELKPTVARVLGHLWKK